MVKIFFITFLASGNDALPEMPFDKELWHTKDGMDFPYRAKMYKDLLYGDTLRVIQREEILQLLGEPDRIDSNYLFYEVSQEHIGFIPFQTKTLVIILSGDSTRNKVLLAE
jgi:hypothetical protein